MQIRCEDNGPHGQTGMIIGPEPTELEEKPTKPEEDEDIVVDPQTKLIN